MLSQPAERRTPQTPQDGGRANGTKQCTKCHETKPLEEFSPHPDTRDGRRSLCRTCDAKRARERRWAKSGIPESDWPRLHACHALDENMRQLNAIFGGKWCPDCEQHLPLEYFHNNVGRADRRDGVCKTCRAARVADYLRTPAGRAAKKGCAQRRRAKIRDLPTDGTGPRDWAAYAEEMEDFECHLCGGTLTAEDEIHWDHLDPVSTGTTGTVLHNMHAAHAHCNLARRNRSLEEWFSAVELP